MTSNGARPEPASCVHHWLLGPAPYYRGIVPGTCKLCGSERTFSAICDEETASGFYQSSDQARQNAVASKAATVGQRVWNARGAAPAAAPPTFRCGHPRTPANTEAVTHKGKRSERCRECRNAARRANYAQDGGARRAAQRAYYHGAGHDRRVEVRRAYYRAHRDAMVAAGRERYARMAQALADLKAAEAATV